MGRWGCSQTPCYGQQKGNGGQGAGQLGLLWNWEEPVLACPYLSLFWERPAGGTLSQASYLQMQHRPSADPGSYIRSSAPTWALGSSSPQESRQGHWEGTKVMQGPEALKQQE